MKVRIHTQLPGCSLDLRPVNVHHKMCTILLLLLSARWPHAYCCTDANIYHPCVSHTRVSVLRNVGPLHPLHDVSFAPSTVDAGARVPARAGGRFPGAQCMSMYIRTGLVCTYVRTCQTNTACLEWVHSPHRYTATLSSYISYDKLTYI